ncbi:MAG: thioredoxin [Lachnospiraceae bacterium]|nr:thioredoxin [Lachnospiraceae bacterium]
MQPLKNKKRALFQCAVLLVSALMIAHGVSRGELETVWNKAVNICLECIGLG